MSERLKESRPGNGAVPPQKPGRNGNDKRTLPGINLHDLWEERNWTALGGLALIGVGVLYLLGDVFDLSFNLWSIVLIILGGWLMADGWQEYQAQSRRWTSTSRNRVTGGAVVALVGVLSVLDLSGWSLFLLIVAGLLGYDTWNKYQQNGRVWTEQARSRLYGAAAAGLVALLGLFHWWSAWPVLLIAIGAAMLIGRRGKR